MTLSVATFNVNSVRARMPNLLAWLAQDQPDVVFLQEIKVETDAFPRAELEAVGYHVTVHGQKSYNGVATLTRVPVEAVETTLLPDDPQARFLGVRVAGWTFINIYAPNGNPVESEKFGYKLRWLDALAQQAEALLKTETPFLIGGDVNIIPDAQDCHDPRAWEGDALFRPASRAAWRRLINLGLTDAFRALHPMEAQAYTFWDYQSGAWPRNNGIRIDHFLLSPQLADRLVSCTINKDPRGQDKASDHTPVVLTLA